VSAKRILFVDNRPEFLHQPVMRLQLEGYRVDEADSGEKAISLARGGGYDLVVLDAELPHADGWEVLQRLKSDPSTADVKAIVLMAGKGETGKLALVEVDAELRRPFTMAELVETVERVLSS
jgi:two-component system, OmpR family, alkaline phosphatase synthesis response regulator PhoP